MIKILSSKYECLRCGSEIYSEREIVVDEYLKDLEIPKPKCACGNKSKEKFKLLNIEILNKRELTNLRDKIILIKEKLIKKCEVPLEQLKSEINLSDEDFEETIDKLKKSGDIFECKPGYIKLI